MTELTKMNRSSKRRRFKREARQLLFSQWLCQILAFVIVGACFVGISQFGSAIAILLSVLCENEILAKIFIVVYFAIACAMFVPLIYGLVSFEINAVNGKGNLADLFCAFSGVELLSRSYSAFFYFVVKSLVYYIPLLLTVFLYLEIYYYENIPFEKMYLFGVDVLRVLIGVSFVVLLYFGFVKSAKHCVGLYLAVIRPDSKISECFFVAKNCEYLNRNEMAGVILSFAPLFVISLFTVGFLFIMYTFPYVLITVVMMSKYEVDTEMSKREAFRLMYDVNDTDIPNNENE